MLSSSTMDDVDPVHIALIQYDALEMSSSPAWLVSRHCANYSHDLLNTLLSVNLLLPMSPCCLVLQVH